jgi:hypothetical protein
VRGGGPANEAHLRQGRTAELTYLPRKTTTAATLFPPGAYFLEYEVLKKVSQQAPIHPHNGAVMRLVQIISAWDG